jgi:hypothetical protein
MKNKIIGYVILARDGDGFKASCDTGTTKATLWFGTHLTLFKTTREAHEHIKRTHTLITERGYDWPWIGTAVIHPVRAAQNPTEN